MQNLIGNMTNSWVVIGLFYALNVLIFLALMLFIPKNRKPTSAMAWLLLIAINPIIGGLLFFLIGNTKLSRSKRKKQQTVTALTRDLAAEIESQGFAANLPQDLSLHSHLIQSLTGFAPTSGNSLEIISGYQEIIDDMTAAVHNAQKYVYVEFYILALDETTRPFFEALQKAVQRGVEVYVLFDAWGSRRFAGFKAMKQRLSDDGINWRALHPISFHPAKYSRPDLRNHRKILVVDNTDAFLGSLNMIEKTYQRKDSISYIELVARFSGPVVTEAAAVFAGDWYLESDQRLRHFEQDIRPAKNDAIAMQMLPSGPGYMYENNLQFFVSVISNAKSSITITNPYLVPDEPLLNALIAASLRGVTVSILNSEAKDQWMVGHAQRSYYERLLQAGVNISLYKKPQLVHEKFLAVDDKIAVIGSSNFDVRSFVLDDECVVVSYDKTAAVTLRTHHEELKNNSLKLDLAAWQKRPAHQVLLDSLARLTSALQ